MMELNAATSATPCLNLSPESAEPAAAAGGVADEEAKLEPGISITPEQKHEGH